MTRWSHHSVWWQSSNLKYTHTCRNVFVEYVQPTWNPCTHYPLQLHCNKTLKLNVWRHICIIKCAAGEEVVVVHDTVLCSAALSSSFCWIHTQWSSTLTSLSRCTGVALSQGHNVCGKLVMLGFSVVRATDWPKIKWRNLTYTCQWHSW
jgi:hypothetical protein